MKKVTPAEGDTSPVPGLLSLQYPRGVFGAGRDEDQLGWLETWYNPVTADT